MPLKGELLALSNGRKILLSLSRLNPSKGIDILIEAFSNFSARDKSYTLFVVGDGNKQYIKKLNQKIKDLKLETTIFMLGSMTGKSKNTVYDIADLYILPSFNEGFGLTVLEAFRQNTPVITTTATSFSEIVELDCGWYIPPTSNDILLALKSSSKLSQFELLLKGRKGYRLLSEKYSNTVINKKMETLYTWMVNAGDAPDFIISRDKNE